MWTSLVSFALGVLLQGPLVFAYPGVCDPDLAVTTRDRVRAGLAKIRALDELALARVAERLARSHESSPADLAARATNLFALAYPARMSAVASTNYDLLRDLYVGLDADELALLASLVPRVKRASSPDLRARVEATDVSDLLELWREIMARDEYRLALVELFMRSDPGRMLEHVRMKNVALGAAPVNALFENFDLRAFLRRLRTRDTSLETMMRTMELVEGVITEIIAHGRRFPAFGEDPISLNGPYLNTMVQAESLRFSAERYFDEVVQMSSPMHVLRALINAFGNVEPLPMKTSELREQILREAAYFESIL